jgi:membrane protein
MKKPHFSLRLLIAAISAFIRDGSTQSAAALTYMTLFAVVPFLTVIYAVFSLIPAFDGLDRQLQSMIIANLLPETGREVVDHLDQLSQQARTLSGFGVVFLGVTAFLMLKNIEHAFNAIWKVPQHRGGINGFLVYWAALTLGPLLIGTGLVLSTYLLSLSLLQKEIATHFGTQLLHLVAVLLSTVTFTLVFFAVPNCKVSVRNAFIGGVFTAIAFEVAKKLFGLAMSFSSYQVVYGAFAAIPLFVLWVYCCWMLVLAGAQITHALAQIDSSDAPEQPYAVLLLLVIERFMAARRDNKTLTDRDMTEKVWLFNRYSLAVAQWEHLRKLLLEQRWLQRTNDGDYVLNLDSDALPLWKILDIAPILPADLPLARYGDVPPWLGNFNKLLTEMQNRDRLLLATPISTLLHPQPLQETSPGN